MASESYRARRALFLVVALLGPSLLGVIPGSTANALTCLAQIGNIVFTPAFADAGSRVTAIVNVSDTNSIPDPQGSRGWLKWELFGPNGALVDSGLVGPQNIPADFSVSFTLSSAAPNGTWALTVTGSNSNDSDSSTTCNFSNPGQSGAVSKTAHFTVGNKPHLTLTSVALVRHDANALVDGTAHNNEMQPGPSGERFTRYPDVTNPASPNNNCQAESTTAPAYYANGHFRVELVNDGSVPLSNDGNSAGSVPVNITIRDGVAVVAAQIVSLNVAAGATVTQILDQSVYSLIDKSGVRPLTVSIDPANLQNLRQNYPLPTDKTQAGAFYVRAPDIVGRFENVRQDAASGKATGTVKIENVGDSRAGTKPAPDSAASNPFNICHSRNGNPVAFKLYLDTANDAHVVPFTNGAAFADLDPSATPISRDFQTDEPIRSGSHVLILVLDPPSTGNATGQITELNESNNVVFDRSLNLTDARPPLVLNASIGTPVAERFAGAQIYIAGNVSDDADFSAGLDTAIFLNMTYPDGHVQALNVLPNHAPSSDVVLADTGNFSWFASLSLPLVGNYSFRVEARDCCNLSSFPAPAVSPLQFTLAEFPKLATNVTVEVCTDSIQSPGSQALGPCSAYDGKGVQPANKTFDPGSAGAAPNNVVRVRFQVGSGMTGLAQEWNNTARKSVQVLNPDGGALGNFTVQALCRTAGPNSALANSPLDPRCTNSVSGAAGPCINATGPNATGACWDGFFEVVIGDSRQVTSVAATNPVTCNSTPITLDTNLTLPAQWNVTIWVGDAGNNCRFRGQTSDLAQNPAKAGADKGDPMVQRFGLWDTIPANAGPAALVGVSGNPPSINARTDVEFRGAASDNLKVNQTFIYLTGASAGLAGFNLTLPMTLKDGNRTIGNWSLRVPTGILTDVDQAGTYNWLFVVQDANRTLSYYSAASGASCTPDEGPTKGCVPTSFQFQLNDVVAPVVTNATAIFADGGPADRGTFQIGSDIAFIADVTDDTRVTVVAQVQTGAGGDLFTLPMTRTDGTTFQSENLTAGPGGLAEGEYRFLVRATDSAGRVTPFGPVEFRVVQNGAPSFVNRIPGNGAFTTPNGTVAVDIQDALQGVLTSSIEAEFHVNGANTSTPVRNLVLTPSATLVAGAPVSVRASFQLPAGLRHGDLIEVNVTASDTTNLSGFTVWSFRLDGQAPRTTLTCDAGQSYPLPCGSAGTQAVRGDTVLKLSAQDLDLEDKAKSGIAQVRYSVDAGGIPGQPVVSTAENTTFRLSTFASADGLVTLHFGATDAAGNSEPDRTLVFQLDNRGPGFANAATTPTTAGWNLTVTITETPPNEVRDATLFYRTGAAAFEHVPLVRLQDTNFWTGFIPGTRRGSQVCYYAEAADRLGNLASSGSQASPNCFASENHPPALTLLSPREGDDASGSLTVRWQVSDIDQDPVTVGISYRRQGDTSIVGVPVTAEEQGSRTKTLDTSGLAAGTYLLTVTASDNQATNNRTSRSVNVTMGGGNATSNRPVLDKATINPGETVKVGITIPQAASDVEARLLKGGVIAARAPMDQVPPGSTHWEASFLIKDPGTYNVEVSGLYEDGTPFVIKGASAITVSGGLLNLGADSIAALVLGAAVVALAALGLQRRRMS